MSELVELFHAVARHFCGNNNTVSDKTQQGSKFRLCGDSDKMIILIINERS